MPRLLLLCCLFVFMRPAHAQQTTVSGRVLEQEKDLGISGVTILQTGSTNGVASDADGKFTLNVPGTLDSISLTVTSIGYVRQQLRVAAGSRSTIRLAVDVKIIECELIAYPLIEIGYASGMRYAPLGATVRLFGKRLVGLPLTAMVSYQTNLDANYALNTRLTLPPLSQRSRLTLSEAVDYQQLRAVPANLSFRSYTGTVGVDVYRIGPVRVPTLLIGAGYAQSRSLQTNEFSDSKGYGYSIGLNHSFRIQTLQLYGNAQATRWTGFWQFQGQLTHHFGRGFQAGVGVNKLRHYADISVMLSRSFF